MEELWKIVLLSLGAVVYLFVISKILGKKQIAQLDFIDYVLGISVGSIAAEMATDTTDKPWYYYIIAMTIFFLINALIIFLERKGVIMKHFFKGRPNMVIYEGKIDFKQLKKSKLDMNELISLARDKGYFDLNEIAYAIFETSGTLSIMPKSQYKPPVAEDMKLSLSPASLPGYLVIDGSVSYSGLSEYGKDEAWMLNKMGMTKKEELKNVILAQYDPEADEIVTHYKR